MGQKTHPLGFRLVTTQKHRSSWYSDFNNYSSLLEEDDKIRTLFDDFILPSFISTHKSPVLADFWLDFKSLGSEGSLLSSPKK